MMKVSVVILNWNAEHLLRQFLPSVVRHSQGEGVEVVVADNGSTDGSLALLAAEFPTVRVVALNKNYGFAEGYNRALAQVDAEYAVLLDILKAQGAETTLQQRKAFAEKAFGVSSHYDTAIHAWFVKD